MPSPVSRIGVLGLMGILGGQRCVNQTYWMDIRDSEAVGNSETDVLGLFPCCNTGAGREIGKSREEK